MEKKITISNSSKFVAFFEDMSKKKEATKKILEEKLIKAGFIHNTSKKITN